MTRHWLEPVSTWLCDALKPVHDSANNYVVASNDDVCPHIDNVTLDPGGDPYLLATFDVKELYRASNTMACRTTSNRQWADITAADKKHNSSSLSSNLSSPIRP